MMRTRLGITSTWDRSPADARQAWNLCVLETRIEKKRTKVNAWG
jgi:hypothetical protein